MLNLILKDFRLQRVIMLLYLVVACLFIGTFGSLGLTVVLIACSYMMNLHYYDDKNNSHKFINSLPYSRKTIIMSKYIGVIIFTLTVVLFSLLIQEIIQFISPIHDGKVASLQEIIISILTVMLLTSIYFPFCYRFANKYLLIAVSAVSPVLIILWKNIGEYVNITDVMQKASTQLTVNQMVTLVSMVIIFIFIASYFLTVKIYKRTDF
ncbi:ABC transporter permease [Bacillus cereus]|nr:ABC transporter permease [Bacillus cereus]